MTQPVIEAGDITTDSQTTNSETFNSDHPAYADGDLLIHFVCLDDSAGNNNLQLPASGPNGETWLTSGTGSGGSAGAGPTQGYVAWVGDGSSGAGTQQFTCTGVEMWGSQCIKVLAGEFDATTPLSAFSGYGGSATNSENLPTPSWTIGADDDGGTVVAFLAADLRPIIGTVTDWDLLASTNHQDVDSAVAVRSGDATTSSETISSVNFTVDAGGDTSSSIAVVVRPPAAAGGGGLFSSSAGEGGLAGPGGIAGIGGGLTG